jgi:hypothetical protein
MDNAEGYAIGDCGRCVDGAGKMGKVFPPNQGLYQDNAGEMQLLFKGRDNLLDSNSATLNPPGIPWPSADP